MNVTRTHLYVAALCALFVFLVMTGARIEDAASKVGQATGFVLVFEAVVRWQERKREKEAKN